MVLEVVENEEREVTVSLSGQKIKKTIKAEVFNKHSDQNNRGIRSLQPKLVYFFGDPELIIALGKFLEECGKQMKKVRPFHRHFRDYLRNWSPDIIDVVVEPKPKFKSKKHK